MQIAGAKRGYVSNDDLKLQARLKSDTAYHRQLRDILAPPYPTQQHNVRQRRHLSGASQGQGFRSV